MNYLAGRLWAAVDDTPVYLFGAATALPVFLLLFIVASRSQIILRSVFLHLLALRKTTASVFSALYIIDLCFQKTASRRYDQYTNKSLLLLMAGLLFNAQI